MFWLPGKSLSADERDAKYGGGSDGGYDFFHGATPDSLLCSFGYNVLFDGKDEKIQAVQGVLRLPDTIEQRLSVHSQKSKLLRDISLGAQREEALNRFLRAIRVRKILPYTGFIAWFFKSFWVGSLFHAYRYRVRLPACKILIKNTLTYKFCICTPEARRQYGTSRFTIFSGGCA